jgi:hypothetical protein
MVKSQMDAGVQSPRQRGEQQQKSVQAGQTEPAQRRQTATQAGGSSEQGRQMNGTQFTDWASI